MNYLLISNIPALEDSDGKVYLDDLWGKDISLHLQYIDHFTLSCPVVNLADAGIVAPATLVPVPAATRLVHLPKMGNRVSAFVKLPLTAFRLLQCMRSATIVHIGVAGWPYPYGWAAVLINKLFALNKRLVCVVESAPWRITKPEQASLMQRLNAIVHETLAKWVVLNCHLVIYTQRKYQEQFAPRDKANGHVIHATWIDAENIIPTDVAMREWSKKINTKNSVIKLLFAGRLVEEKGVLLLLEAVQLLRQRDVCLEIHIIGEGPLHLACLEQCRITSTTVTVCVHSTMPYDFHFLEFVRQFHGLLVPSLGDEQPRIVYDAYSQAVPVIASDTHGNVECVTHHLNGVIFKQDDAEDLAKSIESFVQQPQAMSKMGMAGLAKARESTHWNMHSARIPLLIKMLADLPTQAHS